MIVRSRIGVSLAACVAAVAQAASAALAASVPIPGPGLPGAATAVHVESFADARWQGVVRQRTDFSCGAAALATLLTYAYGLSVSERGVMQGMLDVSDRAAVAKRGFSLLEMKSFLASIAMNGVGYQLTPAMLLQLKVPVIALLDVEGYAHFVVMKKAAPPYVFLADPARGNVTMPLPTFLRSWNGIAFVVEAREYRRDNALLDVRYPASAGRLFAGTGPRLDPATDAMLMSVGSFAQFRLP